MTNLNPITMKSDLAAVPPALAFVIVLLFVLVTSALMFVGDMPTDLDTTSAAVTTVSDMCTTGLCGPPPEIPDLPSALLQERTIAMGASIPYGYLSLTAFSAFTSLFFGAATILEGNANLIDLRAEWLRNDNHQAVWADPPPASPDLAIVDTDGDGLADEAEAQHDCNPHATDTDGDGLTDGQEVRQFGTDPRSSAPDQDNDGVTDYAEAVFSPVNVPGVVIA